MPPSCALEVLRCRHCAGWRCEVATITRAVMAPQLRNRAHGSWHDADSQSANIAFLRSGVYHHSTAGEMSSHTVVMTFLLRCSPSSPCRPAAGQAAAVRLLPWQQGGGVPLVPWDRCGGSALHNVKATGRQ